MLRTVYSFQMGSLQNNHRLTPNQILGHCRVLALALQEQKLNNIKLALREKKFVWGVITTTNTAAILLGMALITELGALRGLTLLLLTILIGHRKDFYSFCGNTCTFLVISETFQTLFNPIPHGELGHLR